MRFEIPKNIIIFRTWYCDKSAVIHSLFTISAKWIYFEKNIKLIINYKTPDSELYFPNLIKLPYLVVIVSWVQHFSSICKYIRSNIYQLTTKWNESQYNIQWLHSFVAISTSCNALKPHKATPHQSSDRHRYPQFGLMRLLQLSAVFGGLFSSIFPYSSMSVVSFPTHKSGIEKLNNFSVFISFRFVWLF